MGFLRGNLKNKSGKTDIGKNRTVASRVWSIDLKEETFVEELDYIKKTSSKLQSEKREATRRLLKTKEDLEQKIINYKDNEVQKIDRLQEELTKVEIEERTKLNSLDKFRADSLVKIDRLKENYDKALYEHNAKYDKLLRECNKVYSVCNSIIETFEIKPNKFQITVTEKEAKDLSIPDVFNLLTFYAEEINEVEQVLENPGKLKQYLKGVDNRMKHIPASSKILITACLTPFTMIGGIFSSISKSITIKKVNEVVSLIHKEVVWCKKILEKQKELIQTKKETSKPPKQVMLDEVQKMQDELEKSISQQREQIISTYDGLKMSKKDKIETIKYSNDIDAFKEQCQKILQDAQEDNDNFLERYEEDMNKLQVLYTEFINKNGTLSKVINKLQDQYSKEKISLSKKIDEFEEYKDLCMMTFITELPEGEIYTNAWKNYLELDNELLKRKAELEIIMNGYKEKGITKETFEEEFKHYHNLETELYLVSSSNIELGFGDLSSYSDLTVTFEGDLKSVYKSRFNNETTAFVYSNRQERDILVNVIKREVLDILNTYHTESCVVNIINPKNRDYFDNLVINTDKVNSVTGEIKKGPRYVETYNTENECSAIFEELSALDSRLRRNELSKLDTYEEYVNFKRTTGGKPNKYNINVLVDYTLDNDFSIFLEQPKGMINFILMDEDELIKKSGEEGGAVKESISYETTKYTKDVFKNIVEVKDAENGLINVSNINGTQDTFTYEPINLKEINDTKDNLRQRVLNAKADPLTVPDFVQRVVGNTDKYFSMDVSEGVLLYIGYHDGDRQKLTPVFLDESSKPHMLICGTTGGGKSVTLSVIVNTLKACYSPEDLDVKYIDLKVAEVGLHAAPNKFPHASVLCGTTCEDYILSVSKSVVKEMDRRYALFDKMGVNKFSSVRKIQLKQKAEYKRLMEEAKEAGNLEEYEKYKHKYENTEVLKRIVYLIDEVAQAWGPIMSDAGKAQFTADSTYLFQLARAAGINIVFVTQDIDKMPSAIVNLLPHRGCTVAPKAISQNALGNDFASRPENRFLGFFGTNDAGGHEQANRQYLVPFSPEFYTKFMTKKVLQLCIEKGIEPAKCVVFNDKEPYDYRLFEKYMKDNKDKLDGTTLVLGEEAKYKEVFEPASIKLKLDDKQGVLVFSALGSERIKIAKILFESLKDKAMVYPVYCKNLYDELPPEYFYQGLRKEKQDPWFAVGKDVIDDVYFEENGGYEGVIGQVEKEDFENISDSASSVPTVRETVEEFMDMYVQGNKAGKPQPPRFLFIFDLDRHKQISGSPFMYYKEWGMLMKECTSKNVYPVFFSSNVDRYHSNEMVGYYLASRIEGINDLPKQAKKQTSLPYIVDLLGEQSTTFKLPERVEVIE